MTAELVAGLIQRIPAPGVQTKATSAVDGATLAAVLAAARVAPSADNAQTWRFVTVQSHETKHSLAEAVLDDASRQHFAGAHTVIAVCGIRWLVTSVRREQPFVFMDVPIALCHILLQATELGLGVCWTLDVNEGSVRELLSIPESVRVVALVGLT